MKKTLIYTTLFIGLALILGLLAVQPSLAQESEMQIANSLYENGRFPEAAQAYEAYLVSAFAKPYILGYYKCQYRDAVLASGQLKQGLRTVDGELRENWARHLARIHKTLLATFAEQGRSAP